MKYIFSVLLLIISSGNLDRIAKINKLKKEAKEAYQKGEFDIAISKYQYLLDSMKVEDPAIRLNMANAYYQSKDTTNALNNYSMLSDANIKTIKSTAYQQQGIIQHQQQKHQEALDSFKKAIKSNPFNEEARYNYEMLKKFLKEQEDQNNQQQNQDQQNQDQQNQDQKDQQDQNNQDQDKKDQQDQNNQDQQDQDQKNQEQNKDQQNQDQQGDKDQQDKEGEDKKQEEGEDEKEQDEKEKDQPGEEKEQNKDEQDTENMQNGTEQKLKDMKITEEKARMILEALKNQEVQYIQQNKKKAKKRPQSNKPDW